MTNKEFMQLYFACNDMSNKMFNIVGLRCKRFTRHCSEVFEKINEQELEIFYKYGQKEAGVYKTDEKGTIIIPADFQKDFGAAINKLHAKDLCFDDEILVLKFEALPLISDDILKTMAPSLFDVLNKHIFQVSDEEYLTALNP
jgi:hypothetical protein